MSDQLSMPMAQELTILGLFSIATLPSHFDMRQATKLPIAPSEQLQINSLIRHLPSLMTSELSSDLYVIEFPKGLPHTLMNLKQGGVSTTIINPDTNRIAGSASLHSLSAYGAVLGAFTAMSIATGQFFLTEINQELRIVNQKIDKILEFLYGDKKAELLGEISFIQFAYENFTSIMEHSEQRIATMSSLQQSRRVAMKDIEFYLNDLNSTVNEGMKTAADFNGGVDRAFQIAESINLSIQLYATSSLLEVFYSQNSDESFIQFLDAELSGYVKKCNNRLLADFTTLKSKVENYKKTMPLGDSLDKKHLQERIEQQINSVFNDDVSKKYKELIEAVHNLSNPVKYIVNASGEVYHIAAA